MYGNLLLALGPHLQFTLTEEEKLPLMCYTRYQDSSSVRQTLTSYVAPRHLHQTHILVYWR